MNTPTIKKCGIRDIKFGRNVTIIEPANLYECEIGNDSFIGPFVEIQNDVYIGERCRIQSHVFMCELVTLGNDCFVSHGAMFINDTFSRGKPEKGKQVALLTLG